MNTKPLMDAIEQRCLDARIPVSDLCGRAGVSPACFTRHRRGENIRVRTIGKLEEAMTKIDGK